MHRDVTGRYESTSTAGESVQAFVPSPLPPNPPLRLEGALQDLHHQALLQCGRLDGVAAVLPNPDLFLYTYVRREALLSSQIEGTQSSLSDLLLFELDETPGVPFNDVVEVSSYVDGLMHGLDRMQELPLSCRLLRDIHKKLLARGRGADRLPGEFRRSQNWIGGTRPGNAYFVPPPPALVEECMGKLEMFINGGHSAQHGLPPLVRAALAHVQFETIHPFLDGNGRLGRLLIVLMLVEAGILEKPLLYLSLFFKEHRSRYYELLDNVRQSGDWEAWLEFFLEGVVNTASAAVLMAQRLQELFHLDQKKVEELPGGVRLSRLQCYMALCRRPIVNITELKNLTGLSFPTANKSIEDLVGIGIARELTGGRRNRLFAYSAYLDMLNEGATPLS